LAPRLQVLGAIVGFNALSFVLMVLHNRSSFTILLVPVQFIGRGYALWLVVSVGLLRYWFLNRYWKLTYGPGCFIGQFIRNGRLASVWSGTVGLFILDGSSEGFKGARGDPRARGLADLIVMAMITLGSSV
jgi:hypothetical protein